MDFGSTLGAEILMENLSQTVKVARQGLFIGIGLIYVGIPCFCRIQCLSQELIHFVAAMNS